VVYHVLTKQDNGDGSGSPTATSAQINFMNHMTNKLFTVYDKVSQTSVAWATFVVSDIIYHDNLTLDKDCGSLSDSDVSNIITGVNEWQFKLHNIICESDNWSGVASFPSSYSVTSVRHNMIRCEYRAVACYDEHKNFLCEQIDGQNVSHTRWWRTRSTVEAHEVSFEALHISRFLSNRLYCSCELHIWMRCPSSLTIFIYMYFIRSGAIS
jgi:hypothetical protein